MHGVGRSLFGRFSGDGQGFGVVCCSAAEHVAPWCLPMPFTRPRRPLQRLIRAGVLALAGLLPLAAASAPSEAAALKLQIVGGLAGLTQYQEYEQPFWTRELARLSGGRYGADIVPFDRAGVPGAEMLRLMELGVVPFGTMLLSLTTMQYPEYAAIDLPGLSADMPQLRANVTAFRPWLENALRERHGVRTLAIYVYPAQVVFCKRSLTRLADLKGRRVRVSSVGQADFIDALGGVPVHTGFAQLMRSLESGDTECAITGTMSGHSLGLYRVTRYLYPLPVTWGLAIFGANQTAWDALPPDLRELLGRELPRLERDIWAAAERDTAEGVVCNSGALACRKNDKGQMTVVPLSLHDTQLRREILQTVVLPRWVARCATDCAQVWDRTLAAETGIHLSAPR